MSEGLKRLKRFREGKTFENSGNGTKWLSVKDGKSVKIRPLQELDDESPFYSEKNGLAAALVVHTVPGKGNFGRQFQSILDENDGVCYGIELARRYPKAKYYPNMAGWAPKTRLYVNVLVDDGENEPYVAVLNQGVNDKNIITNEFIEQAEEEGGITNRWFKLSRKGDGIDTTWRIKADATLSDDPDVVRKEVEEYAEQLFEVETLVPKLSYEEQKEFVARYYTFPDEEVVDSSDDEDDDDWA